MNKTIWKQTDSRWGKKPYPGRGYTVGGAGCGLVACTHVAMEQASKKNWTPNNLRRWMVKKGFAVCGQGTRWEGITQTLKHIGHKEVVRIYNDPMSEAFKELDKGNRIGVILFNSHVAPNKVQWTSIGHYVAFTGYKVKGKKHLFYCKDSGGRDHDGWYSYERSMKGCISKMWIVERTGEQVKTPVIKATTYKPSKPYAGSLPSATVKNGSKGTDAKAVQSFLNWCINAKLDKDGIIGEASVLAIKVYQKTYGLTADGIFGPGSKKKAKDIIKKYAPKEEPKATPSKSVKTNGDKIAELAALYAYSGSPSVAKYPGGKPKDEYKKALNKAYPTRHWGDGPKKGASCDVFVGTVVRNSGLDKSFPRGGDQQEPRLNKSDKFKKISYNGDKSKLKPGDIVFIQYNGGKNAHIFIVKNDKHHICEANYNSTYGITITDKAGIEWRLKNRSGKDYIHVYRAK